MNINNNIDAVDGKQTSKYKSADEARAASFVVVTLILGWLGVILVMMNGGHGFL